MALLFSLIRVMPFEVSSDTYIGVIVTLLTIVVTLVIGYQIFNIIEFKQKLESQVRECSELKEEISSTSKELKEKIFYIDANSKMRLNEVECEYLMKLSPEVYFTRCYNNELEALYYALEIDCEYNDHFFYILRKCLTRVSAHSFYIYGAHNINGVWCVDDPECTPISEHIDDQCALIKITDSRIRKHKNFAKIKYEYDRVMKIFDSRIARIKENHNVEFSKEENDAIMKDTP